MTKATKEMLEAEEDEEKRKKVSRGKTTVLKIVVNTFFFWTMRESLAVSCYK